ncbi:MAG: M20/M25/M40 family metallo-hydrolase [Bryobacteraceae bacterium]
MLRNTKLWASGLTIAILPLLVWAAETVDLSIVNQIKSEAFDNSKVMDHMFYLTDVNGPRLTGSPGFKAAGDWAVSRLKEYGLSNVKEEKWGPFGRGWACKHYEGHMIEPQYSPLIGFPLAWTAGTEGTITGEPVMVNIQKEEDFAKYKGKLKGKVVMSMPAKDLSIQTAPAGRRYTDEELSAQALAPEPGRPAFGPRPQAAANIPTDPEERRHMFEERRKFQEKLAEFLKAEGAALLLSYGYNGDGGTVFAASGGSYDPKKPIALPSVALTPEHYNRIARLLAHKLPVKLEFNIRNEFLSENPDSFNVIAEIPGNSKKDEIVMLGAHLDSWHGGTGATDNAAGSAVVMEAVRILKTLNLKMDRTVRMALWGGEEEGLLGSRAYVKEHFADRENMKLAQEHGKMAGYFNLDNGTGKVRGIYLQGNDMVRPIFEAWMAPFKDFGANTITIRNTGGTDHQSFDAVGLPGFQFIQDPVEYTTRTHHSNMDVYDRIQAGDLMEASAIMASFAYDTAMRPQMLPRKPLPKPQPARRGADGNPLPTGQ